MSRKRKMSDPKVDDSLLNNSESSDNLPDIDNGTDKLIDACIGKDVNSSDINTSFASVSSSSHGVYDLAKISPLHTDDSDLYTSRFYTSKRSTSESDNSVRRSTYEGKSGTLGKPLKTVTSAATSKVLSKNCGTKDIDLRTIAKSQDISLEQGYDIDDFDSSGEVDCASPVIFPTVFDKVSPDDSQVLEEESHNTGQESLLFFTVGPSSRITELKNAKADLGKKVRKVITITADPYVSGVEDKILQENDEFGHLAMDIADGLRKSASVIQNNAMVLLKRVENARRKMRPDHDGVIVGTVEVDHIPWEMSPLRKIKKSSSAEEEEEDAALKAKEKMELYKKLSKRKTVPPRSGGKHECQHCDLSFLTKRGLSDHMGVHNNVTLSCAQCNTVYRSHSSYKNHMRDHKYGPYMCEVCQKVFKSKSTLTNHKQTHLNTEFPCDGCDRVYHSRGALNNHLSGGHDGEKRFECDICHRKFKTKNEKSGHITRRHFHRRDMLSHPLK